MATRVYRNYKEEILTLPNGKRIAIKFSTLEDRYKKIKQETDFYWEGQKQIAEYQRKRA
jgi:hypothetical protein